MRILVTHVPAGSGHQRAAEAAALALTKADPHSTVTILDALDGVDPFYRWCFTDGYFHLVQHFSPLWGVAYGLTDWRPLQKTARLLHRWSNAQHGAGLETLLLQSRPDVVIGTHFYPMEVAGHLKQQGRLSSRLVTVITDYLAHDIWIVPEVDFYIAGSLHTKEDLLARGVPEARIRLSGIPIDPQFEHVEERRALAQRLGVDPERFTILIGSGGLGTGPVVDMVSILNRIPDSLQFLVVAGRNPLLLQRLESLKKSSHHAFKIYGFVNNMHELMSASDLMLTKPGGLSCTEALTKGLPMILVSSIPGQESRNASVMVKMGVGLLAPSVRRVPSLLQELREHPDRLDKMKERARQAVPHHSAAALAQWILSS